MATYEELLDYANKYNPQPQQELGVNSFNQGGMIQQEETPYQKMMRETYGAPAQQQEEQGILGSVVNRMSGQPQQQGTEEPSFLGSAFRGAMAQGIGTLGGQADFVAGATGSETLRNLGDSAQKAMQEYSRPHEYTFNDIFGNGLSSVWKYLSDPNGAAYDIGGGLGSTAAMAAEAALLSAALPSSVAAAGTGAVAAFATRLGLKSVAGALSKGGTAAKLIKNVIASTPLEAASESGGTYREMTTDEQGNRLNMEDIDMDKVQEAMAKNFVGNLGVLGASNLLESVGIGRLFGDKMRQGILGKVRDIGAFMATNAGQNAWEEGAQTGSNLYAQGKIDNISQVVNPFEWNPEQIDAATIGGIAGLGQGTFMGGAGHVLNKIAGPQQQEGNPAVSIQNEVTNKEFGDAVAIAKHDTSTNLVDRMRNLEGRIGHHASDGTNCARTIGLALAGTDYQDLINVDDFVKIAQNKGQLQDPNNYVPKPGDLAVVNDGNHIVMVSENGGTIQNGSSRDGVYESAQSPLQMFGSVKYYISTSDLSSGDYGVAGNLQGVNEEQRQQEYYKNLVAQESQRRADAIREVLGAKTHEQEQQEQAASEAQKYQQENASELGPISNYYNAFTEQELAALTPEQKQTLKNNFDNFYADKQNWGHTAIEKVQTARNMYSQLLSNRQQTATVQQQATPATAPATNTQQQVAQATPTQTANVAQAQTPQVQQQATPATTPQNQVVQQQQQQAAGQEEVPFATEEKAPFTQEDVNNDVNVHINSKGERTWNGGFGRVVDERYKTRSEAAKDLPNRIAKISRNASGNFAAAREKLNEELSDLRADHSFGEITDAEYNDAVQQIDAANKNIAEREQKKKAKPTKSDVTTTRNALVFGDKLAMDMFNAWPPQKQEEMRQKLATDQANFAKKARQVRTSKSEKVIADAKKALDALPEAMRNKAYADADAQLAAEAEAKAKAKAERDAKKQAEKEAKAKAKAEAEKQAKAKKGEKKDAVTEQKPTELQKLEAEQGRDKDVNAQPQKVEQQKGENGEGTESENKVEVKENGSDESGLSGLPETEQTRTVSADAEGRETGAVPGPANGTGETVSQANDEVVRDGASKPRPARTRRLSGESKNVGGKTDEQTTLWGRVSRTLRAFANSIRQLCEDHEDDRVALDDLREEVDDILDKIDKEIDKAEKTTAQQDYDNFFKHITIYVGGKDYHAELFPGPRGTDAIRWASGVGALADRGSKRSLGILMWHTLMSRDAKGNYPSLDKVISSIKNYYKKHPDIQISQAYQDAIEYGEKLKKQKKDIVVEDNRPDNTTKYSATETETSTVEEASNTEKGERLKRSLDDLIREAKQAFRSAKNFRINRDDLIFTMPNGVEMKVNIKEQILLNATDEAKARKDHGISEGGLVAQGYTKRLGKGSLVVLSKEGQRGTAFHETFHTVWDWVLTDKEKAAMLKHFTPIAKEKGMDVEEVMADGYRDWLLARQQHKGTIFGKLYQKVLDFVNSALKVLTGAENVHNIYQQIEEGKVWNRDARGRFAKAEDSNTYTAEDGTKFSVNPDVNPDATVKVVDLTGKVAPRDPAKVESFVRSLIAKHATFTDSENKAILSILPKDALHVTYSSMPQMLRQQRKVRGASIYDIKDVIGNSVLIESVPNKKTSKKPNVRMYHRFYTPVKLGNKIYAIRIVAEEQNGAITIDPTAVNLYDVIVEKKSRPASSFTSYDVAEDGSPTISIRDMLTNVKDFYGKSYFRAPSTGNTKYSVRQQATDKQYMDAVNTYQNAKNETERKVAYEKLKHMVQVAADEAGFKDAIPEQAETYKIRTGPAPKKVLKKVYKVFVVDEQGNPTALFVNGGKALPQGVWLDAVEAWHFTAENGHEYAPTTINPNAKNNRGGSGVKIPNEQVRQELIKRGFLPEGSTSKDVNAVAYRPGWHGGDMPFFPQAGKQTRGRKTGVSNWDYIHLYNQVVFECEMANETDYTDYHITKKGKVRYHDMKTLPKNGSYKFATNPMTNAEELGTWYISDSVKIVRALSEDECNEILAENGFKPQEWQAYGKDDNTIGKMDLAKLGYTGPQSDAARKTLAPITYDDDGNVIPLSQRFNPEITDDVRYSVRLASGKEITSADFPSDFSTSKPGGEEAITDPQMELTYADYESAQKDKDFFDKVIEKTKQVVGLDVPAKDSKEAAEQMIDRMVENIRFLLNKVPEEYRDRAKRWYEGGNKIAKTWAERYGLPKQATAGIIAVLSPQMDWFTNVTLAERVLDAVYGHANERWTNKMTAIAKQIVSKDNTEAKVNLPALKRAKGKTLKELIANGDYRAAAIWVRCYDQCYNDRGYRILTPEGGVGNYVKTDKDENATAAWGNYGPIEKAISIAANPSYANIFYQLGDKHKVRNFANNLNNPDSEFFTTVDTHAVGVGLMQPVSSTKSNSVLQNFGTGSSSSKSVGMSGSYFLYYEAIRRVAKETGLKPREVQSITWEAIRSLFPPHMKFGSEEQKKILELWRQGDEEIKKLKDPNDKKKVKEILDNIRNQVYDIGTEQTGVLREFDWANTPFDATTNDTYKRSNVKIQKFDKRENGKGGSSFGIEAAPDPNNKKLTALWEKVKKENPQLAQQISDEVVENTIRKVFREFGLDFDPHKDLVPRLGGYLGATNPSYELVIENPNLLLPISKMLGKALNQESVMLVSSQDAPGTTPHDIVSISLPEGWGDTEIDEFYKKLYEIKGPKDKNGNPQDVFTGHSTSNGVMTIVNTEKFPVELLLNGIKSVAPNVSVESSNGYCGFVSSNEYGFADENEKEQKPEEVVRIQIPKEWSKKQANALAKKIGGLKNKKGVALASSTSTVKGLMTIEKADKVGMKSLLDAVKAIAPDLTVTKENKDVGLNTEFVPKKIDDRRANLIQREAAEELESKLLAATGSNLQADGSGLDERNGRGDEGRNLKEDGGVRGEVLRKEGDQARGLTTEQTNESTQGDEGASSMPENATEDDLENAKMSVRPGNELAVKIPNGKLEDGSEVKFADALISGKKNGETRFRKNLPRNKWVGISVGGQIIGRVKFGDPYLINKESAEYEDAMIEGVKGIDLTDERPEKYYYPVLDRQDFRDNPITAEKNGTFYHQYKLPSNVKYSVTDTLNKAANKVDAYANRNVREPNDNTATGRAARAFNNTQNKNNAQTFTEWLKDRVTKFYREWVDKNDALHKVDEAIERITGKKLAEEDKIYNMSQGARAYAQGAADTLVQGSEQAFDALRDSLERGIDPKDKVAMDRVNELKKDFKYATMQQVLEPIMTKDMDEKYPSYLEKHGLNNWHDAFSNYLGARRILELVRLVENKSLEFITHDKKEFTDFIDRHPEYEYFRPKAFAKGSWRTQVQKLAQANPKLAERMAKDLAKEYKLPKNVSRADLEAMVREAPKEFGTSAQTYYQLQRNMLTMMELGHLIPAAVHDKINEMYKDYCPLMIDYSDTAGLETAIAQFGRGADSIANVDSMLKHVLQLGSDRGLISPLESSYKSIQALTNRAERNKVAVHFVKTVANSPELQKEGILKVVEGTSSPDAKNCVFTALINGKKVAFQTTQELYGPIVGYDMPAAGIVEGFCRSSAQMLRYGATTSPSFIIRNFLRDTIFAGISSRNGFVPFVDSAKGLWAYWKNKELRGEFDAMGITAYNYFGSGKNAVASMEELMGEKDWQYLKEHPTQLIKELFKMVPKGLELLSESVEASTRMGEYMRARKNGKSMQEAALDARDVTLDFSRSGFYGQRVNMMVPFFNACIQGGDKMFNRMLFSKDPKVRAQTVRMVGLYIMLPSMILWALHKDEPWYEELDPHIKMNNWIIGKFRIPKPQEAGIAFGSGIEAMLDKIYNKDPKAGKEWRAAMLDVLLPNLIPTAGLPILEWITNYSIFRDKAIEGNRLKRLPTEMRYNTSTTEISKAISKAVGGAYGASPVKLDNTIRGYTGTLGMLVAQIPDMFFENQQNLPSKNATERMMVRDFFINDMNLNRTSEDFYNLVNAAQQQHAGYGKKGKPTPDVKAINKALRDVSKQQKDIQEITNAKGISQDAKRQMIDRKRNIIKTIQKSTLKRYGNKYDI